MHFSSNHKARELRRSFVRDPFHFAHVAMQAFFERGDERGHVLRAPFRLESHAAVRKIGDKTGDLELLRDLQCGVTKTNALHVAGEENNLVMHVSHGCGTLCGTLPSIQPAKSFVRPMSDRVGRKQKRSCFDLHFTAAPTQFPPRSMSNFDSDAGSENEWDERGDLAWNEFDWERYLREQDESIHRYLRFYESFKSDGDRIDEVADLMGWGQGDWTDDSGPDDSPSAENTDDDSADFSDDDDDEVYTLHKNPIFIATKAISLSLKQRWESQASAVGKVPQPLALALLAALHRQEEEAVHAIHALDFGDYAMAVSLFKRAMSSLNASLALLNDERSNQYRVVAAYREEALPRLFDLREIWLRVIAECREELERPAEDES